MHYSDLWVFLYGAPQEDVESSSLLGLYDVQAQPGRNGSGTKHSDLHTAVMEGNGITSLTLFRQLNSHEH